MILTSLLLKMKCLRPEAANENCYISHVHWKFQIVCLRCSLFLFFARRAFSLWLRGGGNTSFLCCFGFCLFPFLLWRSPNYSLYMCVSSSPPTISLLHPFWVSLSICFLLQPHFWAYWSLCPCPNFFSRLNSFPFLAVFLLTQSKLPLHLPRAIFLPNPKYGMKVS